MFEILSTVPLEAYIGGLALSVGLVIFSVVGGLEERAAVRNTLRQLDDYEVESIRDQELLAPLQERLVAPFVALLGKFGGRFNPPEYVESVRRKHLQAGITDPDKVERFLALRVLGFVFIPVWLIVMLIWNPFALGGMLQLAATGLGVMIGALGPSNSLKKKVQARQLAIVRQLPDTLDLLVISVEAGLGFEQAVDRVIKNVPGNLSDEFARVLGETRAGASRSDALRSMDERVQVPEIRSFVMSMIQADTFGVSIGRVLRSQADEMRIKRRQRAQESAQKAPVKMMIPMVFCIFPALFVVVIGPAMISIVANFT
ncbi:MAG: type II secretion system F family protein [Acidimicrobiales bacterium]|nr:type II secretion system F family protein [Acidimicrobiales bacterium]